MPLPSTFIDGYPCGHAIPADADQCACGARQAWPRQLELFIWAELHPEMASFFADHAASRYQDAIARYKDP